MAASSIQIQQNTFAWPAEPRCVWLVHASSAKVAATPLDVHDPSLDPQGKESS